VAQKTNNKTTYAIFTELHGGQVVEGGFNSSKDAVAIAQKLSNKTNRSLFVRAVTPRRIARKTARRAKNPRNFKGRMKGYPKHATIEAIDGEGKQSSRLAKQWAEELGKYYGLKAEVVYGHKVKVTMMTDVGEKNFKYWDSMGKMKWNPGECKANPVSSVEDVIKAWLDGQPNDLTTYRGTLMYVPQGKKLLSFGQPLIWWDGNKYVVDTKVASFSLTSRKHYHLARRMWVERFGKDKAPWDTGEVDKMPIEHRGVRGQGAATAAVASNPIKEAKNLELLICSEETLELNDINEHASGNLAIALLFETNIKFLIERSLKGKVVKNVDVSDWSQVGYSNHPEQSTDTFGGFYDAEFHDGSTYRGIFYADGIVNDSVNFDITNITIGDSHLKYFGNILRGNPSRENTAYTSTRDMEKTIIEIMIDNGHSRKEAEDTVNSMSTRDMELYLARNNPGDIRCEVPIVTPAQPNPQTKQHERRMSIEYRAPYFLVKNELGAFEFSNKSVVKCLQYAVSKGMHPDEIKLTAQAIREGRTEWRAFKLQGGSL